MADVMGNILTNSTLGVSIKVDDLAFYEPMRKNWFVVVFYGLDTNLATSGASLSIACKTCTMPKMTTAINEVHRVNEIVYVPGKSSFDTVTLSFYDYMEEDLQATGASNQLPSAGATLWQWQQQIHSVSSGSYGPKKKICHNMAIFQVDPDGYVIRSWVLHNAWPTEVTYDDLDAESGDTLKVSATFRYDYATGGDNTTELTGYALTASTVVS